MENQLFRIQVMSGYDETKTICVFAAITEAVISEERFQTQRLLDSTSQQAVASSDSRFPLSQTQTTRRPGFKNMLVFSHTDRCSFQRRCD